MDTRTISVVVPCFNEGKRIYRNIAKIREFLSKRFLSFQIIAVNDGSTDDTLTELVRAERDFSITVIDRKRNGGKGKAVRAGMLTGAGDIVMFLDADLGIPIESLDEFLPELDKGADIIIASRMVPGLRVARPVRAHRRFMERIFRLLRIAIIGNQKIRDTQCGFKVFTREAAADIFPRLTIDRFAFDAEIVFIAGILGYRVQEMSIVLQNPVRTSVRIFLDPINMIADLFRIRWNGLTGRYRR
jgi:dolichyl-phosphate beta-glucosyltransferase